MGIRKDEPKEKQVKCDICLDKAPKSCIVYASDGKAYCYACWNSKNTRDYQKMWEELKKWNEDYKNLVEDLRKTISNKHGSHIIRRGVLHDLEEKMKKLEGDE